MGKGLDRTKRNITFSCFNCGYENIKHLYNHVLIKKDSIPNVSNLVNWFVNFTGTLLKSVFNPIRFGEGGLVKSTRFQNLLISA